MESFISFLLAKRAKVIYKAVYQETILKSEKKSIEITKKLEEYSTNLLTRYMIDLKLICKHAQLLNGKKDYDESEVINEDSDILKNSKKKIFKATLEELNQTEEIKNFYSSKSKSYDYIKKYKEEFRNITSKNSILNRFFSNKHEELNSISYYNYETNSDLSLISEEKQKSIKYIMSILKTIYLRRYVIKRKYMDYIRFFLINKNELYIST